MNISELQQLPASEKLKIIEALWGDLINDEDNLPEMDWHAAELQKTEAAYLANSIEIVDWEQAKKELRSQFK